MLQSARKPCNEWTYFGTLISFCPFVSLNLIALVCGNYKVVYVWMFAAYSDLPWGHWKDREILTSSWLKTLTHCIGGRYRDALWVAFWLNYKYWDAVEQIQCVFLTASSSISGLPCLSMPFPLSWMFFLFCFLSWKDLLKRLLSSVKSSSVSVPPNKRHRLSTREANYSWKV